MQMTRMDGQTKMGSCRRLSPSLGDAWLTGLLMCILLSLSSPSSRFSEKSHNQQWIYDMMQSIFDDVRICDDFHFASSSVLHCIAISVAISSAIQNGGNACQPKVGKNLAMIHRQTWIACQKEIAVSKIPNWSAKRNIKKIVFAVFSSRSLSLCLFFGSRWMEICADYGKMCSWWWWDKIGKKWRNPIAIAARSVKTTMNNNNDKCSAFNLFALL